MSFVLPLLPVSFLLICGMTASAIPLLPMQYWIGWFTTHIKSLWKEVLWEERIFRKYLKLDLLNELWLTEKCRRRFLESVMGRSSPGGFWVMVNHGPSRDRRLWCKYEGHYFDQFTVTGSLYWLMLKRGNEYWKSIVASLRFSWLSLPGSDGRVIPELVAELSGIYRKTVFSFLKQKQ